MPPIALPEADERPRVARVPVPRVPLGAPLRAPRTAVPTAPGTAITATPAEQPPGAPAAPSAGRPADERTDEPAADAVPPRRAGLLRRLPRPPGRRAPLLLAALVAGALVAAAPSALDAGPVPVDASDYGLGVGGEDLVGLDAEGARRGITEAEARARLSELAASRAAREPKFSAPMSNYQLTSCYCTRWGGQMHWGLDLAAPLGTPIYSATDGVVISAGPASGYGNAVYIQDEDGNVHIYGHMRYYSVQGGDLVRAGDQIATVGNEGFSTGPHLHYEIHQGGRNGAPTDPQAWLRNRGVSIR